MKKDPFRVGQYYHVFSKSIAKFRIFNEDREYRRMTQIIRYYQLEGLEYSFSHFCRSKDASGQGIENALSSLCQRSKKTVRIFAYCLMPTHIHLVISQKIDQGISKFMANILNSYARYFNIKYDRQGHLWAGRFKSVLVQSDEQMVHLSRYIHLNPTTAGIVNKPLEWPYSSYREFLQLEEPKKKVSQHEGLLGHLSIKRYKKFVEDYVDIQRKMGLIKATMLE